MHILQVEGHLRRQIAVTVASDDLLPHVDELDVADAVRVFEILYSLYKRIGTSRIKFLHVNSGNDLVRADTPQRDNRTCSTSLRTATQWNEQ